jgi:NitT/TauT family transport system ATP-binding protein
MNLEVEIKNLAMVFPTPRGDSCQSIFDGIDLNVAKGSFTCILGPSGCGKSTLLNIINGILQPTHADCLKVGGEDIRENPDARRHMGYIFQHSRLLPWRTLKENVIFALKGLRIQPAENWEELMHKYFRVVGLENYMDYFPNQVSGGMQQRASIVRAWANEPRVLLMDEPFSHLDEITARELRTELIRLWSEEKGEEKKTVIFVTHDMSEAIYLADELYMLTKCPDARFFHHQKIDIPRIRDPEDERLFEIERDTKKRFYAELAREEVTQL